MEGQDGTIPIELAENWLKIYKVIREDENIHDFLAKPLIEISKQLEEQLKNFREQMKPIPGESHSRLLIYTIALFSYSEAFYTINKQSSNAIIISNSDKLWHRTTELLIEEISPAILAIFKWDLERRVWRYKSNKISFIKSTIKVLEEELQGLRANLIRKYAGLVFDFALYHYEQILYQSQDDDFDQMKIKKEEAYKTGNQLKFLTNKIKIDTEIINPDIENSALKAYKPIAEAFLEGLLASTDKYDYIISAFVSAQDDFKNLLKDTLKATTKKKATSIKDALISEDIDLFISIIHSILASIPNQLLKNTNEAHYHTNVHLILVATGCDVKSEVSVNNGRIDSIIEGDEIIYIIEYKLLSSTLALKQIKERKYYESYVNKGKKIILLGISFDANSRNINKNFEIEVIS